MSGAPERSSGPSTNTTNARSSTQSSSTTAPPRKKKSLKDRPDSPPRVFSPRGKTSRAMRKANWCSETWSRASPTSSPSNPTNRRSRSSRRGSDGRSISSIHRSATIGTLITHSSWLPSRSMHSLMNLFLAVSYRVSYMILLLALRSSSPKLLLLSSSTSFCEASREISLFLSSNWPCRR